MKRTQVCDLLQIEHPIIQGSMLWLSTAELAAPFPMQEDWVS